MEARGYELAGRLVDTAYVKQAAQARRVRERLVQTLLEHRKWPVAGEGSS